MPGIDELLRDEGARWRDEVDDHQPDATATMPAERSAAQPRFRPWTTTRGRIGTVSVVGVAAAAVVVLAVSLSGGDGSDPKTGAAGGEATAAPAIASGTNAQGAYNAPAPLSASKYASNGSAAGLDPVSGLENGTSSGAGGGAAPGIDQSTGQPVAAQPAAGSPASASALILTGSLDLTVHANDDVDIAATRAVGIADGSGGRVDEDTRTSTTRHSATLVLRVPNAQLPAVITQLTGLGRVRSQDLETRDVTSQVADVNSRVSSARASIAGLTRLYAKAKSVGELIEVESALTARESSLEALEAQQRALAAQTNLATLTLSITVPHTTTPKHRAHHNGFVSGLSSGWHAFAHSLHAIATGVGAALPFAVIVAVLAAVGLLVLRRRHRV